MCNLNEQDILAYFGRIGYNGSKRLTIETLNKLHEHHVFSIPFEGINAYINRGVKLDLASIFNKLIMKKRGGYCYEMDGLFYAVLRYLGFAVKLHVAEIVYDGAEFRSRPPRHAILIVKIDDIDYLVDVGYGRNGLIRPIPLNTHSTQEVYSSAFQLIYNEQDGYVYKFKMHDSFLPEYRFDYPKKSLSLDDLKVHNEWILTTPESPFVQHLIITMPTQSGRISLIDRELRLINKGNLEKISLTSLMVYVTTLKTEFNIELSSKLSKLIANNLQFKPNSEAATIEKLNLSFP